MQWTEVWCGMSQNCRHCRPLQCCQKKCRRNEKRVIHFWYAAGCSAVFLTVLWGTGSSGVYGVLQFLNGVLRFQAYPCNGHCGFRFVDYFLAENILADFDFSQETRPWLDFRVRDVKVKFVVTVKSL